MRITLAVLTPVLLIVGIALVELLAFLNLHEVVPGKAYRSAQMIEREYRAVIAEKGIKSIFNLRGSNNADWYRGETNVSAELGVKHYDFALSASQEVSVEEMDRIVAALKEAPKPILIHCKNGADRSGLVSALYVMTQEGEPADKAYDQLTWVCFHFPYLFWRDTIAMDHSFWRYVDAHQKDQGLARNSKPSVIQSGVSPGN